MSSEKQPGDAHKEHRPIHHKEHHSGSQPDPSSLSDWGRVERLRDHFEHRAITWGAYLDYCEEWATVDLFEGVSIDGFVFRSDAHRGALKDSYAAYRDARSVGAA